MSDLTTALLKLSNLDESLRERVKEKNLFDDKEKLSDFLEQSIEFAKLKSNIKTEFAKYSAFVIENENAKNIFQKINTDQKFVGDMGIEILSKLSGEQINFNELDWDELEELFSTELFSWFFESSYIYDLIDMGALIVGVSVPEILVSFVDEARKCFAFQQHNAVYSLSRTILETAMRDIGMRTGKIMQPKNNKDVFQRISSKDLRDEVSSGKLNERICNLYSEFSSLIHGKKTIDSKVAKTALKETLVIIQELYDKNMN